MSDRKPTVREAMALIAKLEKRVEMLESERSMDAAKKRIEELNRMTQSLILKITVATELQWFSRTVQPDQASRTAMMAIDAMDRPDEWWVKRKGLSIGAWIEELKRPYVVEKKPDD